MFEDSKVKWISLSDMINAFLRVLASNERQHPPHMDIDARVCIRDGCQLILNKLPRIMRILEVIRD